MSSEKDNVVGGPMSDVGHQMSLKRSETSDIPTSEITPQRGQDNGAVLIAAAIIFAALVIVAGMVYLKTMP